MNYISGSLICWLLAHVQLVIVIVNTKHWISGISVMNINQLAAAVSLLVWIDCAYKRIDVFINIQTVIVVTAVINQWQQMEKKNCESSCIGLHGMNSNRLTRASASASVSASFAAIEIANVEEKEEMTSGLVSTFSKGQSLAAHENPKLCLDPFH